MKLYAENDFIDFKGGRPLKYKNKKASAVHSKQTSIV
jgi:hypothetical protein